MSDRKKKEDFSPDLIEAFIKWALNTKGMSHQYTDEAMEKFNLSYDDVMDLLSITKEYWIY